MFLRCHRNMSSRCVCKRSSRRVLSNIFSKGEQLRVVIKITYIHCKTFKNFNCTKNICLHNKSAHLRSICQQGSCALSNLQRNLGHEVLVYNKAVGSRTIYKIYTKLFEASFSWNMSRRTPLTTDR